ncbi:MAG: MotA/TolQ/ExbB proton channel family protein, partial [Myxococcota bacterium]
DVLKLAAVRRLVEAGARDAATDASRGAPLLAAAAGAAGSPRELVKERLGVAGSAAAAEVEAGLGSLALLAALGPLFGLLGTVVGIVLVFNRLAAAGGVASPAELAGGIGTALYTTIAGLVVGILALVFQRYFASRADRAVAQLEAFALFLVELVEGDGT